MIFETDFLRDHPIDNFESLSYHMIRQYLKVLTLSMVIQIVIHLRKWLYWWKMKLLYLHDGRWVDYLSSAISFSSLNW